MAVTRALRRQGLEEALHTMRPGGRRRVILPPTLGFTGDKGPLPALPAERKQLFASVNAGESLVYDVELLSAIDDLVDRGDYNDGDERDLLLMLKREAEMGTSE